MNEKFSWFTQKKAQELESRQRTTVTLSHLVLETPKLHKTLSPKETRFLSFLSEQDHPSSKKVNVE